jgi:RNA polymerase sigma-70 factor (ECF subfamily)
MATDLVTFPGFEAWYLAEHPKVLATLVFVSGNADVAREATDEAFARALARWPRLREMESPGGWLYTVALNLVKRHAKRSAAERRALGTAGVPLVWTDRTTELWSVVQSLPPRQRAAVVLRYLLDMKEREIADVMQISPGTVASTLASARLRLAGWLVDDHEEVR